jgi:hypothetical protein
MAWSTNAVPARAPEAFMPIDHPIHRDQPERRIAIIDSDVASSIAKLGERGALVEGDMVGLGALDLILRSVRARMMGVTLVIEVAGMYPDDRAADATSLGIPAHAVMDLEALRHGRPLRCREELQKAVLALNAFLPERHEHSTATLPHRILAP